MHFRHTAGTPSNGLVEPSIEVYPKAENGFAYISQELKAREMKSLPAEIKTNRIRVRIPPDTMMGTGKPSHLKLFK
jgi:hypothetical protein